MNQTKTFDDLWVSVTTTETAIKYTAKSGVAWSDLEAWLYEEYPEEHWRWRKIGDLVVVIKTPNCDCDQCSDEDAEGDPDAHIRADIAMMEDALRDETNPEKRTALERAIQRGKEYLETA